MVDTNRHTRCTEPIWIRSARPHYFTEHWNAWMKMDRISRNIIRLLVIAGLHSVVLSLTHPVGLWWDLNVMGFMCPCFPYNGKLPGMVKISQTVTVMPLQVFRSQGLGHFDRLGVSIQHGWSICHCSRAQSNWNPQDTPPNNIFAAMNVKINDNKWPSQPCVARRILNAWNFRLAAACLQVHYLHMKARVSITQPKI